MKRSKRGHWKDPNAVRQFFLSLAAEMKFNPTIAENWKQVTSKMVIEKVAPPPLPVLCLLTILPLYVFCREVQPF